MRNATLAIVAALSLTAGAAQAQMPAAYAPPYGPPQGAYGPPQVYVGGMLQADGDIPLPGRNGPPRPLSQLPPVLIFRVPAPQPQPAAAPAARPASVQTTGGVVPSPTPPGPVPPGPPETTLVAVPVCAPPACAPAAEAPAPVDRRPPEWPCGDRFYGAADYLFFWMRRSQVPPLLVVGPLAPPNAEVGGGTLAQDDGQRQGARITFGGWLNACQTVGLEASYFFLGERRSTLSLNPTNDFLTVPFTDAVTGAPSGVPVTVPGTQTGGSTVESFSRLWSAESNLRFELCRFEGGHLDLLAGARYLDFDESLTLDNSIQIPLVPVFLSGANIQTHDFFGAENHFVGGQIGLDGQVQCGRFYADLWGKIALGNMHEVVNINGSTLIVAPPVPAVGNVTSAGGIFAQPTNIGVYTRDQFAVVPEVGIRIGFRLTDSIRVGAGYSFLWVSRVARPGDQIDTTINPTQIPAISPGPLTGPARPTFQFNQTDVWTHGVSIDLEYRF